MKSDAGFRCKRCTGQARPIDRRLIIEGTMGREKLGVVPSFCDLGDCLSLGGGYEIATITRCHVLTPHALIISHFPSPPEQEFTIHVSGVPSSMQAKPGSQPYLTCIACNITTEL